MDGGRQLVGAVDEAADGQVVEDAVRGGRVQAGCQRQILQAGRLAALGQSIKQADQAVDDLNGGLAVVAFGFSRTSHREMISHRVK